MTDLIRRDDALAACQGMDPEGDINNLPAVTVDPKAIRQIVEDEALYWAGLREGQLFQKVLNQIDAALTPTAVDASQAPDPVVNSPAPAVIREAAIRECAAALRKVIDYAEFAGADPDEIEDAAINSYADYLLSLIAKGADR